MIVNIGENRVHLRFDINAMIDFETMSGKNITMLSDQTLGMRDMRTIVYLALQSGGDFHGGEKEAGEWLSDYVKEHGMEQMGQLIGLILQDALGEQKKTHRPHTNSKKTSPPIPSTSS